MAKGGAGDDALGEATEELYGVDPNDFVAARNELVRRLKSEGDRELAAAVAKLRRPTPAAWAVNQLVRRDPQGVGDLVRRGEELRAAQDRALEGAPPDELREAARARREVVAALSDRAVGFLAGRGAAPDSHRNEVTATLDAASLDPEAAAAVRAGRLSTAFEPPSGFGELDWSAVAPSRSAGTAAGSPADDPERAARAAAAEARRLARELAGKARAKVERAARLRRALEDAEDEIAGRERRLADARRKRDEVARELAEAEEEAAGAESAAGEALARLDELPD